MEPTTSPEQGPFGQLQPLPTLQQAGELLVAEAMRRAQGNQSLASRLLGISQPALSKRLKKSATEDAEGGEHG
ncbi:helix-turn-helix domain-containing protein [Oceanisphaera psychrotolerans]|uniref:helix-turn-helix domain-containing protein n=1 Tax=Oceanisphaera psychrotolerans TaxID=1414654 RepID=UPI001C31AB3B|nr:helix-turn-helix domain-containing protein [Oceanisphaera psychrotolerans]